MLVRGMAGSVIRSCICCYDLRRFCHSSLRVATKHHFPLPSLSEQYHRRKAQMFWGGMQHAATAFSLFLLMPRAFHTRSCLTAKVHMIHWANDSNRCWYGGQFAQELGIVLSRCSHLPSVLTKVWTCALCHRKVADLNNLGSFLEEKRSTYMISCILRFNMSREGSNN